jgi:putative oxidoreductase
MQSYGPAVLRLAVGVMFAVHGSQKLFGVWGGDGLAATASQFEQLGLVPALPLAMLSSTVELAGGLLLIFGALTLAAAAALAIDVALMIWKTQHVAANPWRGEAVDLVLMGALISLMLSGAGAISIDGWRARSAEAEAYGRARLRAGRV